MAISWREPTFDQYLLEPNKSTRFCVLTFTNSEINKAIDFLYNFINSYPISKPAIDLLYATNDFIYATAQEPEFVEIRLESNSPDELKKILDYISSKLNSANEILAKLNPQADDYKFFESVINYCKKCIRSQLDEMKNNHDMIYEKYFFDSDLRKLLE